MQWERFVMVRGCTVMQRLSAAISALRNITLTTINQQLNDGRSGDEQPFIEYLFQLVAETHQIQKSLSELSSVTD